MKTIQKIFLGCWIGIIVLLIAFTNTKKGAVSEIDNRRLVDWHFHVDDYFKDRLGFRDQLIHFQITYNDFLFGQMLHPHYEYGKNGHLYNRTENEVYDSVQLDAFCAYLKHVQDYCEKRDVKFVFCLNPNKSTIYPQYLPEGYHYHARFYKMITERLLFYGIHYVDNVALLREIGKSEQVFNFKYDVGHWNDVGAYHGMNHLFEEMAKDFPAIQPWHLHDLDIDTVLRKNLLLSSFVINETAPYYEPHKDDVKETTNRYDTLRVHPGHTYYFTYETDKKDAPSVLFFQDSYCYSWKKFYMDRFKCVAGFQHGWNLLDFKYYFDIFKPEYVVIAAVEGMINPSRLPSKEEFSALVWE